MTGWYGPVSCSGSPVLMPRLRCFLVMVLVQFPAAAAFADVELPEGASTLSRAELYMRFAEKTEVWDQGSIFFSDAGTLQIVWEGKLGKGNWTTKDDGSMCWHVRSWKKERCQNYFRDGENVHVVADGMIALAPELQDGNTLEYPDEQVGMAVQKTTESGDIIVAGQLSREKTIELLSGSTVVWGPARGLYYGPDFTLEKIWDGVRGTGTWSVNEHGAVCWDIPGWGVTPCESYYYRGEELTAVFNGNHRPAEEHLEGNRIGEF